MKLHYGAALVVLGLAAGSARAAFTLVDNFDEYAVGSDVSAAAVGPWTQGGGIPGSALVVADPNGGSGNALSLSNLSGANTSVFLSTPAITMPVGGTATLFFMMQAKNDGLPHEGTAGMTDQVSPNSFSAGRGWTMFGNDGDGTTLPTSNQNGLGSYAQNATNDISDPWGWGAGKTVTDGTWYKIWQVYHLDGSGLTGGTVDYWIQGGAEFPAPVMFRTGYFRTSGLTVPPAGTGDGPAGALVTMVMLSDDPSISYFDNIYVDTGSANLADPTGGKVPEPATIGLLGLGVVGLISRRRARS